MIFSTLCVGEEWCKKYSEEINNLGIEHKIFITTDYPHYFSNCVTIKYTRDVFSYYEKLNSLFKICVNNKRRVTHFDVNKVNHESFQLLLNNDYQPFDKYTIYCAQIYFNESYPLSIAHKNPALKVMSQGMKNIDCDFDRCNYIDEKIISIPYNDYTLTLKKSLEIIQQMWENLYPKGKVWSGIPHDNTGTHESNKWSKQGCGYGEGGALSILVKKLNIKKETIKPYYNTII